MSAFQVVRFTIPAASTAAINIAHSLGVTPTGVKCIAWGGGAGASSGALQTGAIRWSWGATDGTRSFFSALEWSDERATAPLAQAACIANTTGMIAEVDCATDTVTGLVGFTSWNSTQVTVTPSDALAVAMEGIAIIYAGVDFYVDAFSTAATVDDITRTGIPFTPIAAEVCLAPTGSTMGTISGNRGNFCYGVYDGTNQWSAYLTREEGTATNYTFDSFKVGQIAQADPVMGGGYGDEMAFLNFTSDGGVIDRVTGNLTRPMCILWIGGCLAKVGTVAARTAAAGDGTIDVDTTGFDAGLLTLVALPPATATETATNEPSELLMGFASSTSAQSAAWLYDPNNESLTGTTPNITDPLFRQDDAFVLRRWNRSGFNTIDATAVCEIAVSDMAAGNKAVLTQTEEDVATLIGYLALGDAPPAGRRAVVTWAELEVPDATRRAVVTWAELEVPNVAGADVDHRPMIRAGALKRLKYLHSEHAMPHDVVEWGGVFAAPAMRLIGGSEPDLPEAPERRRHNSSRIRQNKRRRG